MDALQNNQEKLTSRVLSTLATTVTEIVTGALLVLFTSIFVLHGGRNIYHFVTTAFPDECARACARCGSRAGFRSLIGYVRATFLVALVDATGIGTGLAIMGVPLALPLASLVFLGAFIPLVGAVIAGAFAVVVALIAKGWIFALITLGLDRRRATAGRPCAATACDGPRGVDSPVGGGVGDRGRAPFWPASSARCWLCRRSPSSTTRSRCCWPRIRTKRRQKPTTTTRRSCRPSPTELESKSE